MSTVLKQMVESLSIIELSFDRKKELDALVDSLRNQYDSIQLIRLQFICTHNSRRSQFSQFWAHVLADKYQIPCASYSGGVEETAVHLNVLKSIVSLGFDVEVGEGENPIIEVLTPSDKIISLWSKKYDHPMNPKANFIAIMTCSHADENCPFVPGASQRIPLVFEDPGKYDGEPDAQKHYDATCMEIGSQLNYVFSKIKSDE